MVRKSLLILIAIGFVPGLSACSSPRKGACVRGSGPTATCGDDFTSAQCNLVNGNAFHEGQSCQDLGFRSKTQSRWVGPSAMHRAP